jgi:hypothetical protein
LFFDTFDKSSFQFFAGVSRKEARFAVQCDFRVIRSLFESRSELLEPPDKLTLLHRTSFRCFDVDTVTKNDYAVKRFVNKFDCCAGPWLRRHELTGETSRYTHADSNGHRIGSVPVGL